MIVVIGSFRLPEEAREAGRDAMARIVEASRTESGCIAYAYAEDIGEPGLFRVSEAWESREALAAHFDTPHMKQWLRERTALGMNDRRLTSYDVAREEPL